VEKPGMWVADYRTDSTSWEPIPFPSATPRWATGSNSELEVSVARVDWIPGDRPTDSGELLLNVELAGVQTQTEGSRQKAAWSSHVEVRNSNGDAVLDRDLGRTAEVSRNRSGNRKSTYRVKVSSALPAGVYHVRVTIRDAAGGVPAIGTTTLVVQ
jgi:hypothetical protein